MPITSPNTVTGMYLIIIMLTRVDRTNVSKRRVWVQDYTMVKTLSFVVTTENHFAQRAHKNATLMLTSIFSVTVHTCRYLHMPVPMNKKNKIYAMYASKVYSTVSKCVKPS